MHNLEFKAMPKLGEGIYSVPEASLILDLPSELIRRWIRAYWEGKFIEHGGNYVWGESRSKSFNFYTLVEVIAVHSLRQIGVSFSKIRLAHKQLSQYLETPYPFASSRLMSDGGTIFWDFNESILIKLDRSWQTALKKIIEPFCRNLDFNKNTSLAQRYWPLGKKRSIVVDPKHSFGQPTIIDTNVPIETLKCLFLANEPDEFIANLYDIPVAAVLDAKIFLRRVAA